MSNKILRFAPIIAIFLLYIGIRILLIEADLPAWDSFNYQPLDEAYYSLAAMRYYFHGSLAASLFPGMPIDGSIFALFENILTYISLSIFDNSLYGLRGGAVLISIIFFITMALIFRTIKLQNFTKTTKTTADAIVSKFLYYIIFLIMALEPALVLLGVVNEPTGFRVAFAAFTLLIVIRYSETRNVKLTALHFGFMAGFNVFFVYPSNMFIIAFILLLPIYDVEKQKQSLMLFLRQFIFSRFWILLGVAIAYAPYALYQYYLKSNGFAELPTLSVWGDRVNLDIIRFNIGNISWASSFAQNNFLLFLLSSTLIASCIQVLFFKYTRGLYIVTLFCIIFFLQSLFLNDYPIRKLNFIVPFLLIQAFIFMTSIKSTSDFRTKLFNFRDKISVEDAYRRVSLGLLLMIYFLIFIVSSENQRNYFSNLTEVKVQIWRAYIGVFLLLVILSYFLSNLKIIKYLKLVVFSISVLVCLYVSVENAYATFSNRTFVYNDSMRELKYTLPSNAFVLGWGGYSLAFAEGSYIPVGNMYMWLYHPNKETFIKDTLYGLAKISSNIYWVGEDPQFSTKFKVPGKWMFIKDFTKHPLSGTFSKEMADVLKIYKLNALE